MKKGGYKIIDFKGITLSGTAVELSGIYDQIVDDYDKPIMVSGVTISGKLQDDAYAGVQEKTAQDLSKSVELTVYGGIITVTEDDEVSFVVSKTTAELTAEIGDLDDLGTTDKDSVVDAVNEVNGGVLVAIKKTSATTLSLDADEAVNGWAYYGSNATNLPTASAFFVLTLIHDSFKCQIAVSRTSGLLYTRAYSSNAWTEWKQATNE